MKKQLNYADILKEVIILTWAVAIIGAAVYFFLVPSHTSVSSISVLGIVLSSDYWIFYLWTRIWCEDNIY